jgi:hypothetical protein
LSGGVPYPDFGSQGQAQGYFSALLAEAFERAGALGQLVGGRARVRFGRATISWPGAVQKQSLPVTFAHNLPTIPTLVLAMIAPPNYGLAFVYEGAQLPTAKLLTLQATAQAPQPAFQTMGAYWLAVSL